MTNLLWNHKRIYSFGAGTQSIAVMVAQAQGLLRQPYDYFVWADVGHDSEDPQVAEYMQAHVIPYCHAHEIPIVRVAKLYKGSEDTVLSAIYRDNRQIPIPVRMESGAPVNRVCTSAFKIEIVDKWIIKQGITHATVGLGFSIDEQRRALNKPQVFQPHNTKRVSKVLYKRFDFPIIDMRLNRYQSIALVERAGLPTPPRSACWFCPFKSQGEWIEDKKHRPEIVEQAVKVEEALNAKRDKIGLNHVYIHPPTGGNMHKLPDAIGDQLSLFEESCDSGYCGL